MTHIVCWLINAFIVVLVVRAVMSWFPLNPGGFPAQINRIAIDLTEWIVAPLRRIIPPVGMIDVSFLVLVFGLFLLQQAIC